MRESRAGVQKAGTDVRDGRTSVLMGAVGRSGALRVFLKAQAGCEKSATGAGLAAQVFSPNKSLCALSAQVCGVSA